jgi:hypothetical protein
MLTEQARERLGRTLAAADLNHFRTEVSKKAKETGGNVAAYIDEFIKARGFERGATTQVVDRFSLSADPGLARLRAAWEKNGELRQAWGQYLAQTGRASSPDDAFITFVAEGLTAGKPEPYTAQPLPTEAATYVFWRTDEREPRAVPFDQARPRVEAAWRFQKARDLAKAEAERLAAEARAANGDAQKLRDLALKAGPRGLIEVGPLAVLNRREAFTGGAPAYDAPMVPPEKVKYAADANPAGGSPMATQLVDLRNKDVGATTVVHDFPRSHYYAAVVLTKTVPSVDEFRIAYRGHATDPMGLGLRDQLFDRFYAERQQTYRDELMKELRAAVKLVVRDTAER